VNSYLVDRIFRGARRKLGLLPRFSSYPFLSGDTYRELCRFELTGETFHLVNEIEPNSETTFFLAFQHYDKFLRFLKSREFIYLHRSKLFIHNGDANYLDSDIEMIRNIFGEVHAVNWNGDIPNVYPIPIGLENQSILMNGVKKDFEKLIEKGLKDFENRTISVLISFNERNNPILRKGLHDRFKKFPGSYIPDNFVSPIEYRNLVCNSRYVISPPGNGIDCHRTWESIYLGAIPVVLDEYWPFRKFNLPVLSAKDWNVAMSLMSENKAKEEVGHNRISELRNLFLEELF